MGLGNVFLQRLPALRVDVRSAIGDDEGFVPSDWPAEAAEPIGLALDYPGITPPGHVRQEWSVPAEAGVRRVVRGGLYAALTVPGRGPVSPLAYQRLFVWSMGGRYRLRPGAILEIITNDTTVLQPVADTREVLGHVSVRGADREARSGGLPGLQRPR